MNKEKELKKILNYAEYFESTLINDLKEKLEKINLI